MSFSAGDTSLKKVEQLEARLAMFAVVIKLLHNPNAVEGARNIHASAEFRVIQGEPPRERRSEDIGTIWMFRSDSDLKLAAQYDLNERDGWGYEEITIRSDGGIIVNGRKVA